jgi:hypothetical protein
MRSSLRLPWRLGITFPFGGGFMIPAWLRGLALEGAGASEGGALAPP